MVPSAWEAANEQYNLADCAVGSRKYVGEALAPMVDVVIASREVEDRDGGI